MLIVCPSCASEYTIDPDKLGADGRTVRCAICRDTWFVTLDGGASPNVTVTDDPREPEAPATAAVESAPPAVPPRSPRKPAFAVLVVLALAAAGWAEWDRHLLSGTPLAGHMSWARGVLERFAAHDVRLGFQNVTADLIGEDGVPVLVVTGEIVNRADREFGIPHLEILVRSGDEKVLATWTDAPPRPLLGPGEALPFSMRFPSPPPDARQVRVQFTTVGGIAVAVHSPRF
jgi:predicted Zn finger-like uncharacterized protein